MGRRRSRRRSVRRFGVLGVDKEGEGEDFGFFFFSWQWLELRSAPAQGASNSSSEQHRLKSRDCSMADQMRPSGD